MAMYKTIAIQARSGSHRWPGKIYHEIDGVSLLKRIYRIACRVDSNAIVIGHNADAALIDYCQSNFIHYRTYLIDENDLLGRYRLACLDTNSDVVVRLTADCPFHFESEIARVYDLSSQYDFVTNAFPPRTTIDGVDCESFSLVLLTWMNKKITDARYREHLPLFIYEHEKEIIDAGFTIKKLSWPVDLSDIKTSIDKLEDVEELKRQGLI